MVKYFNIFIIISLFLIMCMIVTAYFKNKKVSKDNNELSNKFYWGKNEKYKR